MGQGFSPDIKRTNEVVTHTLLASLSPGAMGYIERFHQSLKEEEIWVSEYQTLEKARTCIERYIWEYNHHRRYRSLGDPTPREAFLGFASDLKNRGPECLNYRGALQV